MVTALVGLLGTLLGGGITLLGQWFLAARQQKDQFRLAALDKRLQVHQDAYVLWQKLVDVVYEKEARTKVVLECQEWWLNNCLYLSPKTREAFYWCYQWAWDYDSKDEQMRKEAWPRIMAPGTIIPAAVDLPAIGEPEEISRKLDPQKKEKRGNADVRK